MEMNRKHESHNTQPVTQNRQSRFLTALIDGFNKRTSLTLKMVIITVLVGLTMWISFDVMQARILKNIFQSQLNERLKKQALNDRLSFDRYVKAHIHSVRLSGVVSKVLRASHICPAPFCPPVR
jgi:hypothetical protein